MKTLIYCFLGLFIVSCSSETKKEKAEPAQLPQLRSEIFTIAKIEDDSLRSARMDDLWDSLTVNEMIPFREDTTVLFLYRGKAESVAWNGDFNSWGDNDSFENEGTRVEGTDIWLLRQTFPSDARLDYKITLNGNNWILDPDNPHKQWSGFGPNSELRMPDWKPEPLVQRDETIERGSLSSNKTIESKHLGYSVNYRVYTPPGYENFRDLAVLYVTDGHEYINDSLGATPVALNNLIDPNRIEPLVAVFVDPRSPETPDDNRRQEELGMNEDYLSFFVEELIPQIQENYKTDSTAISRAILGTSLGGLNAAYFAFSRPDIFGHAGIQSPAFWYNEDIYGLVRNFEGEAPDVFMSSGTIGDGLPDALTMENIFKEKNISYKFMKVNEGHSWGAWRAQIDDILIQFFGNRAE